jgi:hypothetical protein
VQVLGQRHSFQNDSVPLSANLSTSRSGNGNGASEQLPSGLRAKSATALTVPVKLPIASSNWPVPPVTSQVSCCVPANLAAVGLEGVHFHDLRHTGNQLTADAGANPKELMARMGQDSARAALIYLHSSAGRQRALADEVGRMAAAALAKAKLAEPSGTQRARKQNRPVNPSGGSVSDLGE